MILLSHIIRPNIPSYGNRDNFIVEEMSQISEGNSSNNSKWIFSNNHLGTHVDVPRHFFDTGKAVTDYKPNDWIFKKIQIINLPCDKAKLIGIEHVENKIEKNIDLLLIRTGYEKYRTTDKYWDDNPGLTPELGFWLRENCNSIRAVGFDFISLSAWKYRNIGKEAHKAFLNPNGVNNSILIIEDMKLHHCARKIEIVIIAPLFVNQSNGSPVSVFAKF